MKASRILEAAMDPVLVVDEQGVIRLASRDLFGHKAAALQGRNVFSLLGTRGHRLRRAIKTAFEDGCSEQAETTIRDTANAEHPVMNHVSPLPDEDGRIEAAVIVVWDLTERRELEALAARGRAGLQHAARMATLGEMAGAIAHEINNPLAIILGYSDQLTTLIKEDNADRAVLRDMTEKIAATTSRIARIIKALRAFARDGTGDPLQVVPVKEILDLTFELCSQKLKQRQVKLELAGSTEGAFLNCRPSEVSQALLNLLNNAVDATEGASERRVRVEISRDAERTEIAVTNTGSEVPEDLREKIFMPFFSTKEFGRGTGLGLSVSQGLLEAQGARLELDATYRGGARFVIRFPTPAPKTPSSVA